MAPPACTDAGHYRCHAIACRPGEGATGVASVQMRVCRGPCMLIAALASLLFWAVRQAVGQWWPVCIIATMAVHVGSYCGQGRQAVVLESKRPRLPATAGCPLRSPEPMMPCHPPCPGFVLRLSPRISWLIQWPRGG